jgi:hypothetical protein
MFIAPKIRNVDPIEFCKIYSRKREGEWGYKSAWRSLLVNVCGVSDSAVQQWGKDFESIPERHKEKLAFIHALKIAESTLKDHGLDGPLQ